MSRLVAFADAVLDAGGHPMEMERRTRFSPVALRVWLPNAEALHEVEGSMRKLGLKSFPPVKVNPHGGPSSYQLVLHLESSDMDEARAWLAVPALPGNVPEIGP